MFGHFKRKKRIYLDYAGATPVGKAAASAMAEAAATYHGNPGAIHADGVAAKHALETARDAVAAEFACKSREIVFTSGGTEANNLAILGVARKRLLTGWLSGTHWVVSSIEHPSVLECFSEIERMGGEVTHVDPDAHGLISAAAVSRVLRRETVLVSIGWGNSEIGTIQPIAQIAHAIRAFGEVNSARILFHTDAGQMSLYKPLQVHTLGVDLLTLDSGKLYGPRGIGALYVGKDVEMAPILLGGKQERGLRPGTENVALAAGFAAALKHAAHARAGEAKRLQKLRDDFASEIIAHIPGTIINGSLNHAMPHILNISIPDIQSEYVTLSLDHAGISISTKSACREGEASRSHVVQALSTDRQGPRGEVWRAQNTLRFSCGADTTKTDLALVLKELVRLVHTPAATVNT